MSDVISKMSALFRERYSTDLKIEWTGGKKTHPVFFGQWKASFVYSTTHKQVSFPLFNNKNELKAIARVFPVENKDAVVFSEMSDLLQLTVGEHLMLVEKKDYHIKVEEHLRSQENSSENIVQLKTKKNHPTSIIYKKQNVKKAPSFEPIWIESLDQNIANHIAFALHDWANNWAFINAREIPDLIWQDENYWKNFPQITIFIPHVDQLDPAKVKIIIENIKELRGSADLKPLVIVTTKKPPSKELANLLLLFKYYKANSNVPPRAQAHFLLFHHKSERPWTYYNKSQDKVYFLPFHPPSNQIH